MSGSTMKTMSDRRPVLGDVEEPFGILLQYVEGLNGETARGSRVSALAAEAFMNNAG